MTDAPASDPKGRLIPAGLPQVCPQCGKPFSLRANYQVRSARGGRLLHRLAIFGGIAGFVVVPIWHGIMKASDPSGGPFGDMSLPLGMTIGLIAPIILFEGLAVVWSKIRTLRCHACGWERDFPWPAKK